MSSSRVHRVRVSGLPAWLDAERLLGAHGWRWLPAQADGRVAEASLPLADAADVQARLRRVGLGGNAVQVEVDPGLPRAAVRAARRADAVRRRDTTPGWSRPDARARGEGRYSLTPERLAMDLARRARGRAVVDACAGAGGNTVAFAREGCRVLALEPNADRRAELNHNLRVYGVAERVEVRAQRLQDALPQLSGDLLFADPPWGADYDRLCCGPADVPLLEPILEAARQFQECWLKLPPSFDVVRLPQGAVEAVFGESEGDRQRVKFLWVRLDSVQPGP